MNDDMQLLREYATRGSEPAFATLVSRYTNLVYSAALRHVGNPHQAEEITQAVFIILARKAGRLRAGTVLSGWLFHTARLTAANFLRSELRRRRREQEAYMRSDLHQSGTDVWQQVAPLLDEGIASLSTADRNAVVLRLIEGKNLKSVGAALGTSEDSVRMRVNRALEKLRKFFARRGVSLSAAAIAGALSANAVQAAPAGLATSVAALTAAKGAATAASTAALIETTLKLMAWAKVKAALVVGAGTLLVAGTATVAVVQVQNSLRTTGQIASAPGGENAQTPDVQTPPVDVVPPAEGSGVDAARKSVVARRTRQAATAEDLQVVWSRDAAVLAQQPFVVLIRPSPPPEAGGLGNGWLSMQPETGPRTIATGVTLTNILAYAYDAGNVPNSRLIVPAGMPAGQFDFMVTLPQGGREALQQLLQQQFGLVARRETREVDALLLTMSNTNAPGLQANPDARGAVVSGGGGGSGGALSDAGFVGGGLGGGIDGGGFGGGMNGGAVGSVSAGASFRGGSGGTGGGQTNWQVGSNAMTVGFVSGGGGLAGISNAAQMTVQGGSNGVSGVSTQMSFPPGRGGMSGRGVRMSFLASGLERLLGQPVIDQTGLTGPYDYNLTYSQGASADEIKQAVLDQLGLVLTPSPTKQPVEFLVVEKAQ